MRVYPSRATPARRDQLAWKIAEVAADPVTVDRDVAEMVINRIIDDAAVAVAAVNRDPVAHARAQALAHPRDSGATVIGLPSGRRYEAEWAGWANNVAVRELDFHDSLMATDYSHPGDTIPPLIAVAQQCGRSGEDLVRAIAAAYEIQVDLVKAIDGKSKGAVYLYQKKLERTRKTHIESEAKTLGGRILKDIEAYCDGLKNSEINLYKFDDEEKCLILNASCLVKKEDIGALGAALSRINAGDIKVVFTGPWSPYSFVSEG